MTIRATSVTSPVERPLTKGMLTIDEARQRAAITIPQAGYLLGLGRSSAYECANAGELPTLKLGGRRVVPVPRLLELVGYPLHEEAPGTVIPSADVFATGRQAGGST